MNKTKKIIFIRHGETDSAKTKKLCGCRTNIPINSTGELQIKRLLSFLDKNKPNYIFTSPLLRAKQTANILASHFRLDAKEVDELKEIDFGDWEGLTFEEIETKKPKEFHEWINFPEKYTPDNGESINDLCIRTNNIINRLLIETGSSSTVYAITHGGPVRAALINALNIPQNSYWDIQIPHGSATCLEYIDKKYKLCFMGQR